MGPDEINFNAMHPENFEDFCNTRRISSLNRSVLRTGSPEGFSFCKTARKPYDVVVCATLIAIKHHLGDYVSVSSDGDFDNVNEWGPAYESVLQGIAAGITTVLPPVRRQGERR